MPVFVWRNVVLLAGNDEARLNGPGEMPQISGSWGRLVKSSSNFAEPGDASSAPDFRPCCCFRGRGASASELLS